MWKAFLKRDDGASIIEESLILGLMAIAAVSILTSIESFTSAKWQETRDTLQAARSVAGSSGAFGENTGSPAGDEGSGQSASGPQTPPSAGAGGAPAGGSPGESSGSDGGSQSLEGQTGSVEFAIH